MGHDRIALETSFLQQLGQDKPGFLILDYDGTLAPFQIKRERAVPEKRLLSLVEELRHHGCGIAVVSGRALDELIELMSDMKPLPMLWGSHGLESRGVDGTRKAYILPIKFNELLESESDFLRGQWGYEAVERKPFSLAVHWRGSSPEAQKVIRRELEQRWSGWVIQSPWEIHLFDGGIELRLKEKHKGTVIADLLNELSPDIPCAYVGDDMTDEDAFASMGDRGFKILLRHHPNPTRADIEISSSDELVVFLTQWLHRIYSG